jgi:hypothetical protein
MRSDSTRRRLIHAALLALATGGLVAVDDPAPQISRDAAVAMTNAGQLAVQGADAVARELRG